MIIILSSWVLVWLSLYFDGPRTATTPPHLALTRYTSLLGISFFIFYFILFNEIGSITNTAAFYKYVHPISYIFISLGCYLTIAARNSLRNLNYTEVMCSLNPTTTNNRIYGFMPHPMYLGMILLVLGSLILLPNYIAPILLIPIFFSIYKKIIIENKHHVTH